MLASPIYKFVENWATYSPNQLALIEPTRSWNYSELASAVDSTCKWLGEVGVHPGDRVILLSENSTAFVALFLALTKMNAWPVLLNARTSASELDQIRIHSAPRLIIFVVSGSPHALKHVKRLGLEVRKVRELGQFAVGLFDKSATQEPVEANPDDRVAALIYTSGTTGLPKGVMLSNGNLSFMASKSVEIRSVTPEDRLAGILPMTHAVGLSVVLLATLFAGASLVLWPRFDPVTLLASLEKDALTILLGTPSMFAMIAEYAGRKGLKQLRFPNLRIISSSGAPLQMATKTDVENLFGMPLHNGYGVTECSPTIALTRVHAPRNDTAVGEVLPGVNVKLVDADRQVAKDGEIGELWVQGPNVMKGYYRAPSDTAEAVDSDGWFNTRDLARMTDGALFIVGRTKDLIVRFGFNVYPAEVEAILDSFPEVVRSAVIGRSLKGTGDEEVVAFVQLVPNSTVTVGELAKHTGQHLASYKQPSHIYLVEEMPLTATGKVRKAELTQKLGGETVSRLTFEGS
jgi:long-chain acyl-CoA synthetase